MSSTTFDTLSYFEKLKAAGVPEEQVKIQAAAFQEFNAIYDEKVRREQATKMDLLQTEMRLKTELTEKIDINKHKIELIS